MSLKVHQHEKFVSSRLPIPCFTRRFGDVRLPDLAAGTAHRPVVIR